MTSPAATSQTYDADTLRLAYEQEVENLREAKRLQWQLAYLGIVALAGLIAADHLVRESNQSAPSLFRWVLIVVGALAALAIGWFIYRASDSMNGHRKNLLRIVERLDDTSHPYLKALLGFPPDYGRRADPESILLILAVVVGAAILTFVLANGMPAETALGVSPTPPRTPAALEYAAWWPLSPEGAAAILATVVAIMALGKQYWNERSRRRAVDGRISAQAYAARRTIRTGWLEHPHRKTGPGAGTPQGDVNAGTSIAVQFGDVEKRFERMASDAPDATKNVGQAVRDALVVFYRATHRIQADLYRVQLVGGAKNPAEYATAFQELKECAELLTRAVSEPLRDS